jgi:hypothetical protein
LLGPLIGTEICLAERFINLGFAKLFFHGTDDHAAEKLSPVGEQSPREGVKKVEIGYLGSALFSQFKV